MSRFMAEYGGILIMLIVFWTIGGTGSKTNRFGYWAARFAKGVAAILIVLYLSG